MIQILIRKNKVPSNSQKYSYYIYTYETEWTNNCSDSQFYLPYQIETNKAYQNYQEGSTNIEKFRIAFQLEENYQTIMNLCVISLINGDFDELEYLVLKAENLAAPEETHHIVLLVEYYLLIHVYDNALKHLINVFNNQEQHEVVENLLKEVCSHKLFSRQHISNLVQDNNMLEQIIKINKQSFVQYHSNISQQEFQSKHTLNSRSDLLKHPQQEQYQVQQVQDQSYQTLSEQTLKTDQLSFISQNILNINIKQSQLDFSFIDIIIDNPKLFQFNFQIPYMIGSYNIKRITNLSSKIAEGGYGEVFLAKHLQTNEIHALKVIKQQEDQQVEVVLQEIIIQDMIQQLNPLLFLNLKPLVYIMKDTTLTDIYIPLELGQFSLYDYILQHQINEIEYNQFFLHIFSNRREILT